MNTNNIDILIQEIYNNPIPSNINNFYGNIFCLDGWYIIINNNIYENLNNIKPFSGVLDNKNWIFVFTDLDKLTSFHKMYINQPLSYMFIPSQKSYKIIKQLEDYCIEGICFNMGSIEWKNTFEEIDYIINTHLKYYNIKC